MSKSSLTPPEKLSLSSLRRATAVVYAAFVLALVPAAARAQSVDRFGTGLTDALESAIDLLPQGVNNVGLGLGPAVYPAFEGSRQYDPHVIGVISFRYRDWLEVVNNEIHVTALNHILSGKSDDDSAAGDSAGSAGGSLFSMGNERSFRAGPLVSVNFGRNEHDSPDLRGMGNVGTSLELGGFVAYTYDAVRVRLRMRQDVADGHKGATAQLDASRTFIRRARWSLSAYVAVEAASAAYMESFFGVTPLQSELSGLPQYHAGLGLKDGSIGLNTKYMLSTHWALFGNATFERLLGSAAASPLVEQRGSPNLAIATAFIVYEF